MFRKRKARRLWRRRRSGGRGSERTGGGARAHDVRGHRRSPLRPRRLPALRLPRGSTVGRREGLAALPLRSVSQDLQSFHSNPKSPACTTRTAGSIRGEPSSRGRASPRRPSDARSTRAPPSGGDIDFSPRSITTSPSAFRGSSKPMRPLSSSPSRVAGAVWPGPPVAAAARPPSADSRTSKFRSWWLATAAARDPRRRPPPPRRRQPEGGVRRANSAFDRLLLRRRRGNHRFRQTRQAQNPRPARARRPKARTTGIPHQQRQRLPRTPQGMDATLPWRRNRKPSNLLSWRGTLEAMPAPGDPELWIAAAAGFGPYQHELR